MNYKANLEFRNYYNSKRYWKNLFQVKNNKLKYILFLINSVKLFLSASLFWFALRLISISDFIYYSLGVTLLFIAIQFFFSSITEFEKLFAKRKRILYD